MQIRSFRRSGEPVWVNALLLKCARLFGTRPAHCGQRPHLPHQQAGHVTVSVSTTKKPIRWTTLAPIGQRSFFSRMRSAEIGIHHHIAGAYLLRYAQERSWRGDNRRLSNGEQVNRLAALSLKRGKSVDFGGYWQRHSKDVHAYAKASHPRRSL